ncbi:MAG: hypothetical protein IJ600_07605 [Lachnospiraceae bacterium]|nr:hypothetical protein [Lachnospiraceae bacterium]
MKKRPAVTVVLLLCIVLMVPAAYPVFKMTRQYDGIYIANREAVMEAIRKGLKNRSEKLVLHFTAYTKDMEAAQTQTEELFRQALSESEDPAGGDYIRYQLGGYELHGNAQRRFLTWHYTMEVSPAYYTSREEEAYVDAEVERLLAQSPREASQEVRIRWVHDLVTGMLSYDRVHKNRPQSHGKTTAYAALRYHQAVCQGYAVLTYRLLKELGIGCRIVTGEAVVEGKAERHAWLMVTTEEGARYLDPTLDDVFECDEWYLKTAEEFSRDHEPEE